MEGIMQNNVVGNIQLGTQLVELGERKLVESEKVYLTFKRISDILISSLALIALMPFMILIGILIKIDSKGKVLFVQERI